MMPLTPGRVNELELAEPHALSAPSDNAQLRAQTVRRWVKAGELVSSKLNSQMFIAREDLVEFIRAKRAS